MHRRRYLVFISLSVCRNYVYIADDECCLNTFGFISSDLFMVIVLKDTLEKRGALGEIKARIRAEVFNALEDRSEPRPPLSHENLLINELIREYLEYNKYKYTSSVLTAGIWAEFFFWHHCVSGQLLFG